MAAHKGNRVIAGIGMLPGVKTDLQDIFADLFKQPLKFRLEVDKAGRVGRIPTFRP